jgi:hypothetical protein
MSKKHVKIVRSATLFKNKTNHHLISRNRQYTIVAFIRGELYTQSASPNFYYKNVLLTETKKYNFLGDVIDFKGSFKKATQELSKKGLKVLFSLKNRFMNFNSSIDSTRINRFTEGKCLFK